MNETAFSIPFFSVVLLPVLFVLLTYSLYKTTSQIPLRSSEQNRLRLWNLLLSLGPALIFSLICALAAPGEGLNSFLYALSQPVWYGLGLMASVFVMAPKVRYSARTLWSFYGQPLRILSVFLIAAAPLQESQAAGTVLCTASVLGCAILSAALSQKAEFRDEDRENGWHHFKTPRVSPVLSCAVLLALSWTGGVVMQLTLSGFQLMTMLDFLCFAALLLLMERLFSKKKKDKPVVLFDLDGTLIDSQPLVFETFRRVFKEKKPDLHLTEDELYSFFGPTLEETFGRYFPKEEVEDVIELYQKINLALHDEMVRPMEGAQDLLRSLKEAGYQVGIVSNKRKPVVERGARVCGLAEYADLIYGKEDLGEAKPDPEGLIRAVEALSGRRDNIIYAGDNSSDMKAAQNMGAWSMGYTTDPRQREALKKCDPDFLADHLRDLEVLLVEKTS